MPIPKVPLKLLGQLERYHLFWWSRQLNKQRVILTPWNREKQAIFVHIPKTAGTTVIDALGAETVFDSHAPALIYRQADSRLFESAHKFAFVRNPWDRFASSFHFMKSGTDWQMQKDWAARYIGDYDFRQFIRKLRNPLFRQAVMAERFFWPQTFWINDRSGKCLVDAVHRFEHIDAALAEICARLNISAPTRLPEHRKSQRPHYATLYDDEAAALIGKIYAADIKAFGYSFEA